MHQGVAHRSELFFPIGSEGTWGRYLQLPHPALTIVRSPWARGSHGRTAMPRGSLLRQLEARQNAETVSIPGLHNEERDSKGLRPLARMVVHRDLSICAVPSW